MKTAAQACLLVTGHIRVVQPTEPNIQADTVRSLRNPRITVNVDRQNKGDLE